MSEKPTEIEAIDPVLISETIREEETVLLRLRRQFWVALQQLGRLLGLSFLLIPLLFTAILYLDIPFHFFDRWLAMPISELPGNWLSRGDILLYFFIPALILITRCYSAEISGRVLSLSWAIIVLLLVSLLIYIAPQLSIADLPSARFSLAFFLSWYLGPLFAAHIYDITKGGKWWRAPLYGLVIGSAVQVAIYFPGIYAGTSAPWISWMIVDFMLKLALGVLFLPVYSALRRVLRPYLGVGGY
ncbi:MAG: hypothetical protein ACWA5L_10345 [bacterium]